MFSDLLAIFARAYHHTDDSGLKIKQIYEKVAFLRQQHR